MKLTHRFHAFLAILLILSLFEGIVPGFTPSAHALDTQAPAAPTNLTSTWRTETAVHLTWSIPSDDSGVVAYDLYQDGQLIGTVEGAPAYWVSGLTSGTVYSFAVRARDAADNVSAWSNPYTVNLAEMDRALWKATASHNSSAASSAIDESNATRWGSGANQASGMWYQIDTGPSQKTYDRLVIDSAGSSGDYARAYKITVSDDGVNWSESIAQGTGSISVNAQFTEQTSRYIRITLTSGVGNWWSIHNLKLFGKSASDTEAPSVPTAITAASVTDSDAQFTWTGSTDNVAVLRYEIYAGSQFVGISPSTTYKVLGLLPNTVYSYTIRARDMAGNVSASSDPISIRTEAELDRTLWTASASSNANSPAAAIDGKPSSRWTSGAGQAIGNWFQVNLGPGDKSYNKLVVNAAGSGSDYPREMKVTVSEDGVHWSEPIATVVGTSAIVTATFPDQTARSIRLTLSKNSGSWWSIHELYVYGTMAPDEVPPSPPGQLTVSRVLDTELELAWSAATDNIAVVGYYVYANSELKGYTTSLGYKITGLQPSTPYSLSVKAKDLSGNVSVMSEPVSVTMQEVIAAPLIAEYEMEPDASNAMLLTDGSGFGQNGKIIWPAAFVDGRDGGGKALHLSGANQAQITAPNMLNNISSTLTITAWIKPEDLNGYMPIVSKRDANWKGTTFYLGLDSGKLFFGSDYGENWYRWSFPSSDIVAGNWVHIAVVFEKYAGVRFYANGKLIGKVDGGAVFTDLLPNDLTLLLGTEWHWDTVSRTMKQYGFRGELDSLRMYASPLTFDQVQADMQDTITTRQATKDDFAAPTKYSTFRLVRFDMPTGLVTKGNAKIHQNAVRVQGPHAVDWPTITLSILRADQTVNSVQPFANGSEYKTEIMLKQVPDNMPLFQQAYDNVLEPGNHWVRGVQWRWGQTNMYTSDRTARSWTWDYELWTFPVKIASETASSVRNVVLKYDGNEIYNSGAKTYDSLTLLLPQNELGKSYELWVNGRGPVAFDAGLQPILAGSPKDIPITFRQTIPGVGPTITVAGEGQPEVFPNQSAWNADVSALSSVKPAAPTYEPLQSSIANHVGIEVPRSPETVHFTYLSHGMSSGGFYHSEHGAIASRYQDIGSVEDYAAYVADTGYDRVFEFNTFGDAASASSHERLAKELAQRGVQLGLTLKSDWDVLDSASPNLAFYSSYLTDFHAPLYRDIQLGLQRFGAYPNLAGINIGADNAGYASYWDWAPPHPNRPWARTFESFRLSSGNPLNTPLAPSLQGSYVPKGHEYFASETLPFIEYVNSYNETYKSYGYFAKAASEVNPNYVTATGSFGSSPGVGARGGWVWATPPGKEMHSDLPVQTAYDWNELNSSMPMHLVSLLDRLRSYYPNKPTWAIQDDFSLFFGKEDREKSYALALTRGIQAIGTNVLANNKGALAKPEIIAEQKELYDWIHRYGGAYAMTEPTPTIGIMYVNEQALLRGIVSGENPTEEQLLLGSHEGKTNEAMFFTQAAGWSSKIVTPEEMKRGLPSSIKALLLVGLNSFDDSWHWYDGITMELQDFADKGGLIIKDAESVSPVESIATDMKVASYIIQSNTDQTEKLLTRNGSNIGILNTVMEGVSKPIATTDSNTIWAVPTRSADTQYVTVVNQLHETATGQTQRLIGQTGTLTWHTDRPIYDVRLGKKLTAAEAAQVDLTAAGFQWYALPPAEVVAPEVAIAQSDSGFFEAIATIRNPEPMSGIPLEMTVTHLTSGDTATIYSATGLTAKLPLRTGDPFGSYSLIVKELLSGLSSSVTILVDGPAERDETGVKIYSEKEVSHFGERANIPLTIALTEEQNSDPMIVQQANRLVQYYNQQGRDAQLGLAEPGGVVRSLQEYQSYTKYPQWRTIDSDLVLLGNSSNNVLILDQARALILPEQGESLVAGKAAISLSKSPFAGEFHALNVVVKDTAGLTAAVDALLSIPSAPPEAPSQVTTTQVTAHSIALSWKPANTVDGYKVERRVSGESQWESIDTISNQVTAFTDVGLMPDTFYTYRIKAYSGSGDSEASDPAWFITLNNRDTQAPTAPTDLIALNKTATTVSLQWTASSDNIGVAGYDVYNGTIKLNETSVTGVTYTVMGLSPETSYTFTVRAKDIEGNESLDSNELTVITNDSRLDRTNWTATASRNSGQANKALDGAANSRWDTGAHQTSGQYYQIDMQQQQTFKRLVMDSGGSTWDFARKYEVYVSEDGIDWGSSIASGNGQTVTSIAFPEQTARYIKIVSTSGVGNFWSIHELNVFS